MSAVEEARGRRCRGHSRGCRPDSMIFVLGLLPCSPIDQFNAFGLSSADLLSVSLVSVASPGLKLALAVAVAPPHSTLRNLTGPQSLRFGSLVGLRVIPWVSSG